MAETTVRQLLAGLHVDAHGASDVAVSGVAYRSADAVEGDVFFCVRGFARDGHDYAGEAIVNGAVAVVVEHDIDVGVPRFVVEDTRAALAAASAALYEHPSVGMRVFGITGTNGKTTTTYLLDSVLRHAGHTTGIIGTVETRVGDERLPAGRTTPESADLHALLARMRAEGVTACAMEVSSHAIDLHRVDGVTFSAVAFTNLTQDHLDFHHTLEEYYSVKSRLFTDFETAERVVNVDDPFGIGIACEHPGAVTVGRASDAVVRATEEVADAAGTTFLLCTDAGSARVRLPLAGAFNVSNALVAAGCALSTGIGLDDVVAGLEGALQVPGRLERVECGQGFSVVVDYAHTPDSLTKALEAIRAVTEGRVITVFGCGGDRDQDKRPVMGRAAGESADYSIITSDNPRSEDPVGIILRIEDGIIESGGDYEIVVDRRDAIERAVSMADTGDAVLIAGKGHEDYQIFADRTVHFDDREVAREVLGRC